VEAVYPREGVLDACKVVHCRVCKQVVCALGEVCERCRTVRLAREALPLKARCRRLCGQHIAGSVGNLGLGNGHKVCAPVEGHLADAEDAVVVLAEIDKAACVCPGEALGNKLERSCCSRREDHAVLCGGHVEVAEHELPHLVHNAVGVPRAGALGVCVAKVRPLQLVVHGPQLRLRLVHPCSRVVGVHLAAKPLHLAQHHPIQGAAVPVPACIRLREKLLALRLHPRTLSQAGKEPRVSCNVLAALAHG